jgi:hypothetical protein
VTRRQEVVRFPVPTLEVGVGTGHHASELEPPETGLGTSRNRSEPTWEPARPKNLGTAVGTACRRRASDNGDREGPGCYRRRFWTGELGRGDVRKIFGASLAFGRWSDISTYGSVGT